MVDNSKRPRGRPRAFDENTALDAAFKLFWTKGFDATTVDDLAEAMQIGRPSMYNAFGDKEAIFMKAMERYLETVASQPKGPLSAPQVRDAIRAYLEGVAEYATTSESCRGCLIGSVASVVDNPRVRAYVAAAVQLGADAVAARLEQAIADGELPADFPVQARARRAINGMIAISTRGRQGASFAQLKEDAADVTQTVFAAA